eukprot:1823949-Rhodomonas_salina.1
MRPSLSFCSHDAPLHSLTPLPLNTALARPKSYKSVPLELRCARTRRHDHDHTNPHWRAWRFTTQIVTPAPPPQHVSSLADPAQLHPTASRYTHSAQAQPKPHRTVPKACRGTPTLNARQRWHTPVGPAHATEWVCQHVTRQRRTPKEGVLT